MKEPVHYISLGAGVQSSALALMAAHGEIGPMPQFAIFADTGWESLEVYQWLDRLSASLPFPVLRVQRDGLDLGELSVAVASGEIERKGSPLPPWFLSPNGMLPLQCSKEFKTRVVQRKIRSLLGLESGQRGPKEVAFVQWLGISTDEAHRMKDCEIKWIENRWPLIDADLSRSDCLAWFEKKYLPLPPRSSCVFCPFHTDREWVQLRDGHPEDWKRAVEFDAKIRRGYTGLEGEAFVHKQRLPLDQVDFSKTSDQPNMFGNECEGICGV